MDSPSEQLCHPTTVQHDGLFRSIAVQIPERQHSGVPVGGENLMCLFHIAKSIRYFCVDLKFQRIYH